MIETKVDDVLVRVSDPDAKRLAWFGRIIVLKEKDGDRRPGPRLQPRGARRFRPDDGTSSFAGT